MVYIVQTDDAVIRVTAQMVPKTLFNGKKLQHIIADMSTALDAEQDGVALAAPQIGIPYCIFIVRYDRTVPAEKTESEAIPSVGVYINPQIIKTSRRNDIMEEGCLSVRGVYGKTKRYIRATVRAYDEYGRPFVRGGGGILAQIFQHEIDHLNGTLFIDHATDLYKIRHDEIILPHVKHTIL